MSAKNLLKNGYLFLLRLYKKKDFAIDLKELIKKWPSPYQKKPLGYVWHCDNSESVNEKNKESYGQRQTYIKSLQKKGIMMDFHNDINAFIEKHALGGEWFLAITDYIISFWLYPPPYNLNIEVANKRITLELNPDTSLDDVKDIWPLVKTKKSELWPNFKKINFTKKSFTNFEIATRDLDERIIKKNKRLDTSEYQEYKINDMDIASTIWDDEEEITIKSDEKRKVNLRQIRKRFKEKQA